MNLQSLLMEKWPYKIAAIVLSVLVWLNVTANRETQGQAITTRLEVEVRDTAWAIAQAPTEVTTMFQGRSGDIVALLNAPVLRATIDSPQDSVVELSLSVDDVEYDRSLSVLATSVSPPRVFVHLEPRLVRKVPVLAMTDATAGAGLAIHGTRALPDSVTVSGPASAVEAIVAVATERLELGEIRQGVSRTVGLQRPDAPPSLRIEPQQVSLTVEVDSVIVRRFQLTVQAAGATAGAVSFEPQVVVVVVTGAAGTVSTLTPTDLAATVSLDRPFATPERRPVRVALPPGLRATVVADPDSVLVRPLAGG